MAGVTYKEATEPDFSASPKHYPAGSALTTGVRINTISTAHECDIEDLPRSEATCIRGVSDIAHFLTSRKEVQEVQEVLFNSLQRSRKT